MFFDLCRETVFFIIIHIHTRVYYIGYGAERFLKKYLKKDKNIFLITIDKEVILIRRTLR